MTTDAMIHVPTTETDVAVAAEYLRLCVRQHQREFGEHVTTGAYLGRGVWELIDWTQDQYDGPIVVGLMVAPGKRVGTIWLEPVTGAAPVVRWERTA